MLPLTTASTNKKLEMICLKWIKTIQLNYKATLGEITEYSNSCRDMPCPWIGKLNIVNIVIIFPKSEIQCYHYQVGLSQQTLKIYRT